MLNLPLEPIFQRSGAAHHQISHGGHAAAGFTPSPSGGGRGWGPAPTPKTAIATALVCVNIQPKKEAGDATKTCAHVHRRWPPSQPRCWRRDTAALQAVQFRTGGTGAAAFSPSGERGKTRAPALRTDRTLHHLIYIKIIANND